MNLLWYTIYTYSMHCSGQILGQGFSAALYKFLYESTILRQLEELNPSINLPDCTAALFFITPTTAIFLHSPSFDLHRDGGGRRRSGQEIRRPSGQAVCQIGGHDQARQGAQETRRAQEAPLGVHALHADRRRGPRRCCRRWRSLHVFHLSFCSLALSLISCLSELFV